jgi:hypothetical protein
MGREATFSKSAGLRPLGVRFPLPAPSERHTPYREMWHGLLGSTLQRCSSYPPQHRTAHFLALQVFIVIWSMCLASSSLALGMSRYSSSRILPSRDRANFPSSHSSSSLDSRQDSARINSISFSSCSRSPIASSTASGLSPFAIARVRLYSSLFSSFLRRSDWTATEMTSGRSTCRCNFSSKAFSKVS